MMKSLRDQSLNTPRAVRRDRRKNLAGSAASIAPAPGVVGEQDVAASPTPQAPSSSGSRAGLDNLLASGQELMARLTGEGVSLFLEAESHACTER